MDCFFCRFGWLNWESDSWSFLPFFMIFLISFLSLKSFRHNSFCFFSAIFSLLSSSVSTRSSMITLGGLIFSSWLTGRKISARSGDINPVDTNGFWHAPGSVAKPCEVAGVMAGFCSVDLSEGVACWTWLTIPVASSFFKYSFRIEWTYPWYAKARNDHFHGHCFLKRLFEQNREICFVNHYLSGHMCHTS